MRLDQMLATLVIALFAGTLGAYLVSSGQKPVAPPQHQTAMARIKTTGTLNCGYVIAPPYFMKDPASGRYSGIMYELTEKLAGLAHIGVTWTQTTFMSTIGDLKSGRIDAFCSGMMPASSRAMEVMFSEPAFHVPIGIFVRADDARFGAGYEAFNKPQVKFAAVEGTIGQIVKNADFPEAGMLALPPESDLNQVYDAVAEGKADATINPRYMGYVYEKNHPGKLKEVMLPRPIRVYGSSYATLPEDAALNDFLSAATREAVAAGYAADFASKYALEPGSLYPQRPAYDVGAKP